MAGKIVLPHRFMGWGGACDGNSESQCLHFSYVLGESPYECQYPGRSEPLKGRTPRPVAGMVIYEDGATMGRVRMESVRVKT